MPAHSFSAASVYSGYEVDDDWCVSVLQSYQADRDVLFPWSVGKPLGHFTFTRQINCTQYYPRTYIIHLKVLLHGLTHTVCIYVTRWGYDSGGKAAAGSFLGKEIIICYPCTQSQCVQLFLQPPVVFIAPLQVRIQSNFLFSNKHHFPVLRLAYRPPFSRTLKKHITAIQTSLPLRNTILVAIVTSSPVLSGWLL